MPLTKPDYISFLIRLWREPQSEAEGRAVGGSGWSADLSPQQEVIMKTVSKFTLLIFFLSLFLLPAAAVATPAGGITVSGACTLTDAITAANNDTATGGCPAGSGADTITLTADVNLTSALPTITSEITLEGGATPSPATILSASSLSRPAAISHSTKPPSAGARPPMAVLSSTRAS